MSHDIRPHVRKNDVRRVFFTWDKEKRGCLSKHQLKCAMLSLFGKKPPKEEIKAILAASFDDTVDLPMFERLMFKKILLVKREDHHRDAFESLCTRKGQVSITQDEFIATLKRQAPLFKEYITRQAFMQLDLDDVGCLKYTAFQTAMTAD